MIALKHILVPVDFSETSAAAVRYGVALARLFGAKLHLLHVGEKATSEIAMEFPLGLEGTFEDAMRERLVKILTPQEQLGLQHELLLRPGTPYLEIVRYARDQGIDLIVIGTHGRGFVAHAVMGSVAERVVRHAPCPVLSVRHPQHEFVTAEERTTRPAYAM